MLISIDFIETSDRLKILGQKFSFVFLFTFPRKQIQDPINIESHCNTTCYNANLDVMLLCHDFHPD